jgi:hypothetical protein
MMQQENTNEDCPFCGQHLPEIKDDIFWLASRGKGYGGIKESISFECPHCNEYVTFTYYIDNDGDIHYESTEYDDGESDKEEIEEYYADQERETYRDKMYDLYESSL